MDAEVILCLETSAARGSVALVSSAGTWAELTTSAPQTHAAELAPMVREILQQKGIGIHQLAAVAVSSGPGSYTGLRIGFSLAKGICFAQQLPLIMTDTLAVLASAVPITADYFIPMIDARRMEVYTMVANSHKERVVDPWAEIVTAESYAQWLEQGIVAFHGDGAPKCQTTLIHPNARWPKVELTAAAMGKLAWKQFLTGDFANVIHAEPFYLKEFRTTTPRGTQSRSATV